MKILKEQSEVTTKPTTLSNGWGVSVKVPSGFTKVDSWSDYSNIEEGAIVYINPNYAQDSKDARKFFVMELSRGHALLADTKSELRRGEGRIYDCIEYYKNPIYESKQGNKDMKILKENFSNDYTFKLFYSDGVTHEIDIKAEDVIHAWREACEELPHYVWGVKGHLNKVILKKSPSNVDTDDPYIIQHRR